MKLSAIIIKIFTLVFFLSTNLSANLSDIENDNDYDTVANKLSIGWSWNLNKAHASCDTDPSECGSDWNFDFDQWAGTSSNDERSQCQADAEYWYDGCLQSNTQSICEQGLRERSQGC